MGLHPFKTNDKATMLLIYDAMTKQVGKKSVALDFPSFDMALVYTNYDERLIAGSLIKRWIIDAKDEADFLERSKQGMQIFLAAYPELKITYPEMDVTP